MINRIFYNNLLYNNAFFCLVNLMLSPKKMAIQLIFHIFHAIKKIASSELATGLFPKTQTGLGNRDMQAVRGKA
ncbi:MAG: hypothetical protein JWP96_2332 [Polaromonas sp.]|nr:hypothetical protein [Polaromonas sp.]